MKKISMMMAALLLVGCTVKSPEEPQEVPQPNIFIPDKVVSFMAVGDNLIHGAVYYDAYVRHNGVYDFNDMYENVKDFIQSKDVAYINQETILGGVEMGLSHYPQFNSPHEVGMAVAEAGFDWVASSSNHSMDQYEAGILSDLNFWDQYPDVVTTGLSRSFEEMNTPKYIERNGVKIGVLGYTYGTNGIPIPEGKEYLVNLYSKERIQKDVEALKGTCDVIAVSMHWGDEYATTPNEEQQDYAQFLADLGVSVIIGEHPHVIQPMDMLEGKDGNQTLVIYSLGNFLSAQDEPLRMLGGCASFDVRVKGDGTVTVENVQWYPTVNHFDKHVMNFKIYLLKDYTNELAAKHGLSVSREYFIQETNDIMGDQFEIVY